MAEPLTTETLQLPSFAKVNLSLRILGRRPDGYHEIRTVLQTISLGDELTFTRTEDGSITLACSDPRIPIDESNLVIRAARVLQAGRSISSGASIVLEKRIPSQAGLGGASSNAALTLLALNQLWATKLDSVVLQQLAAGLGADVPFFLYGGRALATGTGTSISPLPASERKHLLLIKPNASIATRDAYRALQASALTTPDDLSILSCSSATPDPQPINDFEQVVFRMEPEIERAARALRAVGARDVMLSGSGSCVFGIFENEEVQTQALGKIRSEPGWISFSAVTISRGDYRESLQAGGLILPGAADFGI